MYGESRDERAMIEVLNRRGVYPLYITFADRSRHFTLTAGDGHILHEGETMDGHEFAIILERLGIVANVLYGPNGPA